MFHKTTVMLLESHLSEILGSEPVREIPKKMTTLDNVLQLIGLVILLIVILVAAYYTSKFIGGIKLGQLQESNFEVIDTYRISPNKVLQIVKIANKYVVIAVGKDTVSYITELDETEVRLKMSKPAEKYDFKKILEKLRNNKE